MTPDVAAFLRNMLANSTLNVGAPDFVEVSIMASKALGQLDQILQGNEDS
jgi:hypothetical protein